MLRDARLWMIKSVGSAALFEVVISIDGALQNLDCRAHFQKVAKRFEAIGFD